MDFRHQLKFRDDEQLVNVIKRYGLTLFWSWLVIFILVVTPFFFMFWLFRHGWWGQVLFAAPLLLGILLLFKTIFIWQKNICIITTERLVDIDQKSFFQKVVSNVSYDQVEDIMGKISGFWGTIFRYGNLVIQTGNGKVQIVVDRIKNPVRLQQEIAELREKYLSSSARVFLENATEGIIDKFYELDLPELVKVQKALDRRIQNLRNSSRG